MAGNFTDDLAHDLLDLIFGAVAYSPAASFEIALYTVAPTNAGGGTEVSTGVWTNYSRVVVTRNQTNFPASALREISNGLALDFGTADITGTAPEVVAVGVLDATSDRIEAYATLAVAKTINDTDPVDFLAGELAFRLAVAAG